MFAAMVRDDRKDPIDQQIDENLRKVYQRTLEEDVPERFHDLLRKLREQGAPE
ncbi:MAG: NepR family anti-sigma factor [Pseudomonadota bacterium]